MSESDTADPSSDDSYDEAEQGIPDSDTEMISDEAAEQIERERAERLDPENRPTNAEVDNTQRKFDTESEEFEIDGEDVDNGPVIGADRPEGVEVHDD